MVFAVVGEESIVVGADKRWRSRRHLDVDGGHGGVAVNQSAAMLSRFMVWAESTAGPKNRKSSPKPALKGSMEASPWFWDAVKFSRKSVTSCSVMGLAQPTMSAAAAAAQRSNGSSKG